MKVRYWISTNKTGSECRDVIEFDNDEWNSMTDDERNDVMKDAAFNNIEWGFEVVESPESESTYGAKPDEQA